MVTHGTVGPARTLSGPNCAGDAGSLAIAADTIVLDGAGLAAFTGISAASLGEGREGNGGDVTVEAGTLSMRGGAQIDSDTFGRGRGRAGPGEEVLDGAGTDAEFPTGIFATSEDRGSGGSAGGVTLEAGSLRVSGGAKISSSTFGPGRGGDVAVRVRGEAVLDRTGFESPTGVATTSENMDWGGDAGDVSMEAASLRMSGGAVISSDTFGPGDGGGVAVQVRRNLVLNGLGTEFINGISASSQSAGPGGKAGSVTVEAGSLRMVGGKGISSDTFGLGDGGSVAVRVRGVVVLNGTGTDLATGISATSQGTGRGGDAGDVTVGARVLTLRGGAEISSSSAGDGNAGTVSVTAGNSLAVRGGLLSASAPRSQAGGVFLAARDGIDLVHGIATAESEGSGGNIGMAAGRLIQLSGSFVTAQAGGDGGQITLRLPRRMDFANVSKQASRDGTRASLGRPVVVLDDSIINGLSGGRAVIVTIQTENLLSSGSQILTNTRQRFPETDLSGSVAAVNTALLDSSVQLAPLCGLRLDTAISSFIVTNRGGVPAEPGGWGADGALDLWLLRLGEGGR